MSFETVRRDIQTNLRQLLQETALALCATAVEFVASQLLDALMRRLHQYVLDVAYASALAAAASAMPAFEAPEFAKLRDMFPEEQEGGSSLRERIGEITGLSGYRAHDLSDILGGKPHLPASQPHSGAVSPDCKPAQTANPCAVQHRSVSASEPGAARVEVVR